MALDLSAPAYLPMLRSGTLHATGGNVLKVSIDETRPRVYTVFAGANALVVGWGSQAQTDALADAAAASGSFLDSQQIAVPASGSVEIGFGPNHSDGLPSPDAFFIWSATNSAPYAVTVSPARVS